MSTAGRCTGLASYSETLHVVKKCTLHGESDRGLAAARRALDMINSCITRHQQLLLDL